MIKLIRRIRNSVQRGRSVARHSPNWDACGPEGDHRGEKSSEREWSRPKRAGGKASRYSGEVRSGKGEMMERCVSVGGRRGSGREEGAGQVVEPVGGQGAPRVRERGEGQSVGTG